VRRLYEIQLFQSVSEFVSRQRLHGGQKPGGIRRNLEGEACQAGQAGREGGETFRCRAPWGTSTKRIYEYRNRMFVHVSPIPPRGL
jgi:hypothetical protein